jgi:hypothetical protein
VSSRVTAVIPLELHWHEHSFVMQLQQVLWMAEVTLLEAHSVASTLRP